MSVCLGMCGVGRGRIGREGRPGTGGRGLKCLVKEMRMGSQQSSVSKSEGGTLCFGRSFLAVIQKKGQREGRQEARAPLGELF